MVASELDAVQELPPPQRAGLLRAARPAPMHIAAPGAWNVAEKTVVEGCREVRALRGRVGRTGLVEREPLSEGGAATGDGRLIRPIFRVDAATAWR